VDYSRDYPERTGRIIGRVSYEELRSGSIEIEGTRVQAGSLSSYRKALDIAERLAAEIRDGSFLLAAPLRRLPAGNAMKPLAIRPRTEGEA